MSKPELIALFDWYDFRDRIGHKLTMCEDFHDLIQVVIDQQPSKESL